VLRHLLCDPLLSLARFIPDGAVPQVGCYNTSAVTDVTGMFDGVRGFPWGLAIDFDTSSVAAADRMLCETDFRGPIHMDFASVLTAREFLSGSKLDDAWPVVIEGPRLVDAYRFMYRTGQT
jgi:hypothetical protein